MRVLLLAALVVFIIVPTALAYFGGGRDRRWLRAAAVAGLPLVILGLGLWLLDGQVPLISTEAREIGLWSRSAGLFVVLAAFASPWLMAFTLRALATRTGG
jgi:uncharacterized membrane protein